MRLLRPTAIIAAFLIIAFSVPPSLFSQPAPKPSQPKQPAPPKLKTRRPQRADALAPAVNELLKLDPPAPKSLSEKNSENEDASSEEESKPPADDAPIKELIAYWSEPGAGAGEHAPKPSDKVRQRLLEACEERPEILASLMNFLPDTADTHHRLYKLLNEEPEGEKTWKFRLHTWLRRNTEYYRDELIKAARRADDNIDAIEDLRALARLDWNKASPLLETLASAGEAFVTPVALTSLCEHAAQESDSARAESYRALLKAIVENRQASCPTRLEALAGLMNSEWSGQEEWFISLFADPTLGNFRENEIKGAAESKDESSVRRDSSGGVIVMDNVPAEAFAGFRFDLRHAVLDFLPYRNTVLRRNADKWLPVISNLVGHNQPIVHKAAVKCLVKFLHIESIDEEKRKEIARKLIPWLTEPDWAIKEDRAEFVRCLVRLNMPELAPGLIWVLDYDEDSDNRAVAAKALAQYRDPRAIPALRRALDEEKGEQNREMIVIALAECGGLSDGEMAEAIEAYMKTVANEEGAGETDMAKHESDKPPPLKVSIGSALTGHILNHRGTIQTSDGLAVRLLERAKALRATEPVVAREILRAIEAAPLRVAEVNLVERIGEGWADIYSVTLALEHRDALRKSAGDELYRLIKQGGYATGIAAAILIDEREWKAALKGRDAKAQLALIACARYLRDKLPVDLVATLLNSPNRALAKATESYLEIEDSPEARKLVLARHPGEAYILGDITAVSSDSRYIEAARSWEEALRKEMRGRNGSEAIYAVARTGPAAEDFTGVIIRVRGGKAEMSVHETEGRRNVRWLTDGEFEELKSLTSRQEVEYLGPESYSGEGGSNWLKYEYLRLTKEGGLRIALDGLQRAPKNPTPHEELSGLFHRLSRSGEGAARYNIEDKIPGVEVIFADKKQSVLKVCGEGGEIRALIEEKGDEYRQGSANAPPEWREFSSGKPGEIKDEPSACRILNTPSSAPKYATVIRPSPFGRPAQSDGPLFYATYGEDGGIWKGEPGMDPVKIVSGNYSHPVITPDGKWFVAIKWVAEEGNTDLQLNRRNLQLIRRNLQSREEYVVTSAQNTLINPWLAYIAAHDKVLVLNFGFPGKAGSGNEKYLLDPETETFRPVKGEFRPLTATLSRAPQSTGTPNLFWVAIYDSEKRETGFGRYDSKNFVFTPLLEFPELTLSGDDIWVDEASGKIWFTYKGHLLRLPFPQKVK
jgi:HEAT repeats